MTRCEIDYICLPQYSEIDSRHVVLIDFIFCFRIPEVRLQKPFR